MSVDSASNSDATEPSESAFSRASLQVGRSCKAIETGIQAAFRKAQRTSRKLAEERPIHLVAGVAVAGFAAGLVLKIWRSRHA
jgi:hypothetical protein